MFHKKLLTLTTFFTFTILILILQVESFAQYKGKLSGFVKDSSNGEALPYCSIYVEEIKTGVSSNDRGYFVITNIPENKSYTLNVSFIGYETKKTKVFIQSDKMIKVNILLKPIGIEMPTIVKYGEKKIEKNATDIGLQRINLKGLETLPKGVEVDIFRSLQYIPGVRTTGDVSAKYYVRGGASNQNLVLLDGAAVYNPFHALGMFSVIDPEMINNIDFYKGGFAAEYGGRLSSVLNINSKDGNKNDFGAKASSSYLSGKVFLEGPLINGSFLLTGRKSYSSQILKKFLNNKNLPFDFYDLSFRANYKNPNAIENPKFTIHGFLSSDRLANDDPFKEDVKWVNNILGFKWYQIYDDPFYSELNISYSKFKGEVIPKLSNSKPRSNELSDLSIKFDFNYIFDSKDELRMGIQIQNIKTKLYFENQNGIPSDINSGSASINFFTKYKFLRYDNFGLDIGSRINLASLTKNGNFFFEPRISTTYRVIPQIALKAAWGIYQQELTTTSDENEVISLFEPWVIIPEYLNPARAIHYTAGIDFDFLEYLTLSVEGYYEIMKNLPSINNYKKYPEDPDLLPGTGESYGSEFSLKITPEPIQFIASYSLAWAYKEVDKWVYYPKYDSRHTVNLSFEYNLGSGWSASAVWSYSTGLPFTQIIGFYDKLILEDFYSTWPIYESYSPFVLLGDKNIGRLPDYHRLDFNLSKKLKLAFINLYFDVSIINVYDRKNIFYFDRKTGERVNMLPFLPTATIKIEL